MKKVFLLLCIACIFSASKISAQFKTVDSLVHSAFNSIRNVDEQAYLKMFPTFPQLKTFFNGLVNSVSDSTQKAAMAKAFSMIDEETYNSEIKSKMVKSFQEFISNGRLKGIDWTRARLDSFTTSEDEHDIDFKTLHGKLYFTEQGNEYVVPFSDIIWMKEEQGWFGFEMKRILKKGEDLLNDDIEVNEMAADSLDSVAITMDTTMVDTAPQSQSKKPVNKKPAPKKTETKQPAKKPSSSTKPKTKS